MPQTLDEAGLALAVFSDLKTNQEPIAKSRRTCDDFFRRGRQPDRPSIAVAPNRANEKFAIGIPLDDIDDGHRSHNGRRSRPATPAAARGWPFQGWDLAR